MTFKHLRAGACALGASAMVMLAAAVPASASPSTLRVCSGTAGACPAGTQYSEIADAVAAAHNGDWILVWPGYYRKAVTVDNSNGLTRDLHIVGMNRNGVVLDGSNGADHGIFVNGVNDTVVENMTGQNFTQGSGNSFWWAGVDGYQGNYLTSYNTTNYGVYAYDSTSSGATPSTFAFDYASWSADSGIYIGGCRDCHAVITNSRSAHNALGYSGTNAGGELYLINSEWDHNRAGILPNTLTSEPDPPQSGANIVGNYVHDNNATDTPGTGLAGLAPLGTGIDLAGGSNNIVRDNLITNQKHWGVLQHWLFTPPINNQIVYNRFDTVGRSGTPGDADIGLDGTSVQTCMEGNTDITGGGSAPATTDPPNFAGLQNCGNANPGRSQLGFGVYGPGDPIVSVMTALDAAGITEPGDYQGPGPRPDAQQTKPNPCDQAPDNPWCPGGSPIGGIPTSPS